MARWTKRPYIHFFRDEGGLYTVRGIRIGTKARLSNGQILRLDFFRSHFTPEEIGVSVDVRNRFSRRKLSKEGTPTGPGGTEVWGVLSELFAEGEIEAVKRLTLPGTREIVVHAASEELHRIYAVFLRRRGYFAGTHEIYRSIY